MRDTIQTTLIMETQPELIQKTCRTLSSSLEDFLAKLSVLLENEEDLTKQEELSFLRLQGFPDDWTKYGKDGELISDTQRYKCCGNAVTTNVITAIVDEMFEEVKS